MLFVALSANTNTKGIILGSRHVVSGYWVDVVLAVPPAQELLGYEKGLGESTGV
jgi:hypothetical protein